MAAYMKFDGIVATESFENHVTTNDAGYMMFGDIAVKDWVESSISDPEFDSIIDIGDLPGGLIDIGDLPAGVADAHSYEEIEIELAGDLTGVDVAVF